MGVNQHLRVTPGRPPFHSCFFVLFLRIPFFRLVTEKDKKTCFNAETIDFDQGTACEAPIRWLKYTTEGVREVLLYGPHNFYERPLKIASYGT